MLSQGTAIRQRCLRGFVLSIRCIVLHNVDAGVEEILVRLQDI